MRKYLNTYNPLIIYHMQLFIIEIKSRKEMFIHLNMVCHFLELRIFISIISNWKKHNSHVIHIVFFNSLNDHHGKEK